MRSTLSSVVVLFIFALFIDQICAAKVVKTCYFDDKSRQYFVKDGQHLNGMYYVFY